MTITFEETARRENVWLRGFLMGPTGSGKSRGALELATRIARIFGDVPVTLINSEKGRGKLYADRFRYSLIEIDGDFSPQSYVKAIDLAEERTPGGVVVIDSASHEWMGANGVLQQADRFGEWKKVRPLHNEFVERILAIEGHVLVCCRAKMKYDVGTEVVQGREKQVITMLGVGPIQSDDMQYEFNWVARFDQETKEATFSGHVDALQGVVTAVVDEAADRVAETLTKWCSEGEPPEPPAEATQEAIDALTTLLLFEGHTAETIENGYTVARRGNRGRLHPDWVAEKTAAAEDRAVAKAAAEEATQDGAHADEERATERAEAGATK